MAFIVIKSATDVAFEYLQKFKFLHLRVFYSKILHIQLIGGE